MDTPPPNQKQGLGPLAWIGIGCGSIVALAIVGFLVVTLMFGDKIKQFAEDAQKNPTRAAASMMVTASAGQMEMVAEDDANRRYTVKDKNSGAMTTIYWSEKKNAPDVIPGDFSAIPAESAPTPALPDAPANDPAPAAGKN